MCDKIFSLEMLFLSRAAIDVIVPIEMILNASECSFSNVSQLKMDVRFVYFDSSVGRLHMKPSIELNSL